jgi:PAS domain S-box-containing protein
MCLPSGREEEFLEMQKTSRTPPAPLKSGSETGIAPDHAQPETETEQGRLLQLICKTMPAGLVVQRSPGRIDFVNRRFAQMLGYRADQLAGKPLSKIVSAEDQNNVRKNAERAIAGKPAPAQFTFRVTTRDNKQKHLRAHVFHAPWQDRPTLIWYIDDISQTKISLAHRHKHRNMSCTLFDIVPISTAIVTWQEGRVIEANPSFFKKTGYLEAEVVGYTVVETGFWPDPEERSRVMRMVGGHGIVKTIPIKFKMKNGQIRDCFFSAQLVEFNNVPCTLEIFNDVSPDGSSSAARMDQAKTLSENKREIENLNTALKVLIDHQKSEREDQQHNWTISLKKSIFPYLDKIKNGKMDMSSRTYLSMIESNLNDLVASLPDAPANLLQKLTFAESQVADLVRQGKTSKEIAAMLNVTTAAISFHRHNLRKKLGLLQKRTSLRSHLQSLKH